MGAAACPFEGLPSQRPAARQTLRPELATHIEPRCESKPIHSKHPKDSKPTESFSDLRKSANEAELEAVSPQTYAPSNILMSVLRLRKALQLRGLLKATTRPLGLRLLITEQENLSSHEFTTAAEVTPCKAQREEATGSSCPINSA